MINTTNLSELVYPGLRGQWGLAYPHYVPEWSQIFPSKPTSQKYEKTLGMSGFGLASLKAEGTAVDYDDPFQGAVNTLTQFVRGLGFIVTKEMYTDDQYGKINALSPALKYSMMQTKEWDHANVLNRAFNSSYTGADGLELCSLLHTLLGGGTLNNEPDVNCDLGLTSLEQATIDIGDFTDDRGLKIQVKPLKLVIATANDWTAKQLLGSEKDPEMPGSNALNPAKGMFPQGYIVNHYLTDADAWFILTDVQMGLVSYAHTKWGLDFTKDNDFGSDNALFKATDRYVAGWDDWRCIWGSTGA